MNAGRKGPENLWGLRAPPAPGSTDRIDVGPLRLWLRSVENEIWITYARAEDHASQLPESPDDDADWSRWAMKDDPHHLRITPVFPDRSLVVKPEHPFTLLRRARARVYMRVPIWVKIEAVDKSRSKGVTLTEIPTEVLSETWWGDFLEGELAYWLTTKARRGLRPDHFQPHLVMTTLQLTNLSEDDLRVEKLSLRVEHLSIYQKDGWLWAEEVKVNYHGEAEGSEVHMDDTPPEEAAEAEEISPARFQARSLRARTFARLRALSGFGQ